MCVCVDRAGTHVRGEWPLQYFQTIIPAIACMVEAAVCMNLCMYVYMYVCMYAASCRLLKLILPGVRVASASYFSGTSIHALNAALFLSTTIKTTIA